MTLIKEEKFNKLLADEGKHIRDINDTYEPAHYDEEGNYIEEHFPYYFEEAYIPKKIINIDELYVEEDI